MGIISLIISIISISISVIVTGIPFYCKYIEKKTKIWGNYIEGKLGGMI